MIVEKNSPGRGERKPGNHAKNSRLSAPARTEQAEKLAILDCQADAFYDSGIIEMFGKLIKGNLSHRR